MPDPTPSEAQNLFEGDQPLSEQPETKELVLSGPEPEPAPWSKQAVLPRVITPMPAAELQKALAQRAKQGKLAGYQAQGPRSFSLDAAGGLYERTLIATIISDTADKDDHTEIWFEGTLNRTTPIIVIAVLIFTLWPGVWFTDSVLSTWFGWYRMGIWWTCAWYIPLTLLALPVFWANFKKSERESWADAEKGIEKIARIGGGEVVGMDEPEPAHVQI
jgi:hypothetical protein